MKRVIIPAVLAVGLFLSSCNTSTSTREHSVKSNDNKTEVRDKVENDSAKYQRDRTIRQDDNGNVKTETKTEKKDKSQ